MVLLFLRIDILTKNNQKTALIVALKQSQILLFPRNPSEGAFGWAIKTQLP
jgi:hypothetical protein